MPYITTPEPDSHQSSEPLPNTLGHKPFYAVPYQAFDGRLEKPTDVRYISIGIAQYDSTQVSIKTMQHTGEKWSRQSEELPLHRTIDMTLFMAKSLFESKHRVVDIPAGTFENQTNDIHIVREQRSDEEIENYTTFLAKNNSMYKERFNALLDVLVELKEKGQI